MGKTAVIYVKFLLVCQILFKSVNVSRSWSYSKKNKSGLVFWNTVYRPFHKAGQLSLLLSADEEWTMAN